MPVRAPIARIRSSKRSVHSAGRPSPPRRRAAASSDMIQTEGVQIAGNSAPKRQKWTQEIKVAADNQRKLVNVAKWNFHHMDLIEENGGLL